MTLELLFAKAAQGRTFLLMAALGALLALCVQLCGCLHRLCRPAGLAADLFTALGAAAGMAQILQSSGAGLRLYALLGLCIGAALYAAGLAPAVGWFMQKLTEARQHIRT